MGRRVLIMSMREVLMVMSGDKHEDEDDEATDDCNRMGLPRDGGGR